MKVEVAEHSGYCFGVKRALNMALKILVEKKGKKIFTFGEIIHNPGVIEDLERKGIYSAKEENKIKKGCILIIRSHGMPPAAISRLRKKGVKIVDATCPFVKKAQSNASKLSKEGYFVVVIGDRKHPEVIGIKEQVPSGNIKVISSRKGAKKINQKKVGVIIQTTQTIDKLKDIVSEMLETVKEIKIINTICNTTKQRQEATRNLAAKVDAMLVVGGRNSANTTHLAEISREMNKNTYHIEGYKEIDKKWIEGARRVGVSGGASTPKKDIDNVKEYLESIEQD